MNKRLICKKKRGLSTVITTLLFIGLALGAIGLVWTSTNSMVQRQIKSTESCYGISEKVQLNNLYTCYENDNGDYKLRFLVEVSEVQLGGLMVLISTQSESKSYLLTTKDQSISNLNRYPNTTKDLVVPGQNEAFSYIASGFDGEIEAVEISPIMNDQQCPASDTIVNVDSCDLIAG